MQAARLQKRSELCRGWTLMNGPHNLARRAKYCVSVYGSIALLAVGVGAAKDRSARVNLFPRLQAGQTLAYQLSYHSDKHVMTESRVIVAATNDSAKIDVSVLLRLEVLSVQAQGDRAVIHVRTKFEVLGSDSHFKVPNIEPPATQLQRQDPDGKFIEFTIFPDGHLDKVTGLDALLPEQQQAWQEWASRFLLAAGFRISGVRIAQKWNSEEAEKSSSPIAGLRWMRESTYVRDEPCRAVQLTVQGSAPPTDAAPENCAVILTTAVLKQDSNKNATPEDFKLHELRTVGTAHGTNRIITYISVKTGIPIRATEEATQQMNVTVAKADGSNRVRYDVNAKSRSEVLLVSESPLNNP
jgi:hypothetical protein